MEWVLFMIISIQSVNPYQDVIRKLDPVSLQSKKKCEQVGEALKKHYLESDKDNQTTVLVLYRCHKKLIT